MEMKVGLLKGTVDEGQWGKSAVLEEEVEEVPAWPPRECYLVLRSRTKDRWAVGQWTRGVCVRAWVHACACVKLGKCS